jgi:hypothetical protein
MPYAPKNLTGQFYNGEQTFRWSRVRRAEAEYQDRETELPPDNPVIASDEAVASR